MAKSVEDLLGELTEGIEREQRAMRQDLAKQLMRDSTRTAEHVAHNLAGNVINPDWLLNLTERELGIFQAGMRLAADLVGDPGYDI